MKIKELLADKSRWTQRNNARDEFGNRVYAGTVSACCWCLYGAAEKCYGVGIEYTEITGRLKEAARDLGFVGAADFNDRSDHKTVLALVERLDV